MSGVQELRAVAVIWGASRYREECQSLKGRVIRSVLKESDRTKVASNSSLLMPTSWRPLIQPWAFIHL